MQPHSDPDDANLEDVSWRLDESLRSCRAILSNYRALFAERESAQAASSNADAQLDDEAHQGAFSHLKPEKMVDALGLEPRTR